MGKARFFIAAVAGSICAGISIFAAAMISTRFISCGGAETSVGQSRPAGFFCALTDPPITTQTEAACAAFEYLESDLQAATEAYQFASHLFGDTWEVLIYAPSVIGGWIVYVSAESGEVTEVVAQR
jgi:hypothetical protein